MPNQLTTYGKYKYLYDSICEITNYAHEKLEKEKEGDFNFRIHSMVGVFIDGESVCDGNAKAYYYLCKKLGLYCGIINALPINGDESGHAYNYIMLGGKYYFVDSTWGDEGGNHFAFTYGDENHFEHDMYLETIYDESDIKLKNFMQNLGTINWSYIEL